MRLAGLLEASRFDLRWINRLLKRKEIIGSHELLSF
jgi:hypothetical protein